MTTFTRLTVVGTSRRAELVVPDDEALGTLLPRLMDLLAEPTGPVARPLTLVRITGEQLDAARSAADQELVDGEQLRLVRADDAPPPPEVADVTDVVADSYSDRSGRWSDRAREAIGALTLGAAAALGGLLAGPDLGVLLAAAVVCLLVATTAGRRGHRWTTIGFTAVTAGLVLPLARTLIRATATSVTPLLWVTVAAALVWLVLGVGIGVGLGRRSAVGGAAAGFVLTALPVLLAVGGLSTQQSLAITAAAAAVAAGLLPWYALTTSGLTGLDDQVLAGRPGERDGVATTVDEAYRTLAWAGFAVALPLTGSAALLVTATDRWPLALGVAAIALTALRTRAFPLVVQQAPLAVGAVAATATGLLSRVERLGAVHVGVGFLVLAVVVLLAVGVRPAAHVRARLRRYGNLIEAIAVIGLVPLVLGVFGVYADLIGAFR